VQSYSPKFGNALATVYAFPMAVRALTRVLARYMVRDLGIRLLYLEALPSMAYVLSLDFCLAPCVLTAHPSFGLVEPPTYRAAATQNQDCGKISNRSISLPLHACMHAQ
jgi:hypothetical protein